VFFSAPTAIRSADNRQTAASWANPSDQYRRCQAGSDADITNSSSIKQAVLTQADCCAYARTT
jgi:hypothetical protein